MRVLSRILVSIGIVSGLAASTYAQQTLSCGAPQDSFTNAAIVDTTNGTSWALQSNLLYLSWQTSFAVAPAAIQIDLQGSLDNVSWASIDSTTSTTGALRYVSGSNRFIRARVISHTTGSGMTVTFNCTKAGGSSGYSVVENEATGLIRRNIVNFVGNGVDCVDDTSKTTCTVSGLAGAAYGTVENEGAALTQRSNINFVGAGVDCADTGGKTVCTISGGGGSSGYATIQEEGSSLTQRTVLNFTGAGATCSDSGGITVCNITGGGGASFPLQGSTTCAAPEFSFTADTDSGLCLNAANEVRVQTAPLATSSSGILWLQGSGSALLFYNSSGVVNSLNVGNASFTVTLNAVTSIFSIAASPPALTIGSAAGALSDPIKIVTNTANGSHTGTITSSDLTSARTWTLPDSSGTFNLVAIGSTAPNSGNCTAATEVGAMYTQYGSLSVVNGQTFICTQTDSSPSFAWMPIGHLLGTAHPSVCTVGNIFFDTNSSAGSNLELCTAANTWTAVTGGGGGGFTSPGQGFIVDAVGDGTLIARTLSGGEGIIISNSNGAAGNPTIAIDSAVVVKKGSGTADPPACGDTGDAFQIGDFYYETDTVEFSTCTAIDTWLCINCASINPGTTLEITEECILGNNTSGAQGAVGLSSGALSGGTATMSASSGSLPSHPGLCEIQTGTTDDGGARYEMVNSVNGSAWGPSWASESWQLDSILRYSDITESAFFWGIGNTTALATISGAVGVWRDTDLSHTAFVFKVCDSATTGCQSAGDDTNQDSQVSSVTPTNGDWFRVRLSFDAVNQKLTGQVDNETPVTFCASGCTSTIANMPTVAMRPIFVGLTRSTTAKNIDLDYWKLHMDFVTARY